MQNNYGAIIVEEMLDGAYTIGGAPLIDHVLKLVSDAKQIVILSDNAIDRPGVSIIENSTPSSLCNALNAFGNDIDNVLIVSSRTPLIKKSAIDEMMAMLVHPADNGTIVMASALVPQYLDKSGTLDSAVAIFSHLKALSSVAADAPPGLPGLITGMVQKGILVSASYSLEQELGYINSKIDLALAEHYYQTDMRAKFLTDGVTIISPDDVFFGFNNQIKEDAIIHPYVVLGPNVTIERGAEIKAFSYLINCTIKEGASIGPFASVAQNSEIGANANIGNFVEIKRSIIEQNVKAKHLSYIGDTIIGSNSNIGAGVVTCNYDGKNKKKTHIKSNCFVGANTSLIAPLTIGRGAYISAGSVITSDVPDDAFAIARSKQSNKANLAKKLLKDAGSE